MVVVREDKSTAEIMKSRFTGVGGRKDKHPFPDALPSSNDSVPLHEAQPLHTASSCVRGVGDNQASNISNIRGRGHSTTVDQEESCSDTEHIISSSSLQADSTSADVKRKPERKRPYLPSSNDSVLLHEAQPLHTASSCVRGVGDNQASNISNVRGRGHSTTADQEESYSDMEHEISSSFLKADSTSADVKRKPERKRPYLPSSNDSVLLHEAQSLHTASSCVRGVGDNKARNISKMRGRGHSTTADREESCSETEKEVSHSSLKTNSTSAEVRRKPEKYEEKFSSDENEDSSDHPFDHMQSNTDLPEYVRMHDTKLTFPEKVSGVIHCES